MAAEWLPQKGDVMENFDFWTVLYQLAFVVVALLGGAATVPIVRWLKEILNTNGGQTLVVVAVVSAVLGLATAVLDGILASGTFSTETFGVVAVAIFAISQARYRQILDDLGDLDEAR
jgi:hypothetical protein